MKRMLAKIREKYTYIIITTLIVGLIIGYFTSSPGKFVQQFNIPLIIIMIGAMGFSITFKNLGVAVRDLKGVSFGLVMNFIFAPLLCWLVALMFLSAYPDLAIGLILIGVVPCAGMALVWTGLLKGDTPLATVINAITMFLAPFLIPLFMSLFIGRIVTINTWDMFQQLIYAVLLPILGGVTLREILEKKLKKEGIIQNYLPVMPVVSAIAAVLLLFMAININVSIILKNISLIYPLVISTILIFPILFLIPYLASAKFFSREKNIAITYSSGMKNLPIAIGIAAVSFGPPVMLPIAVGFAFQMLTACGFCQLFRRFPVLEKQSG